MQFLFNYLGVVLDIGQSKGLDNQGKHKVYFREKEIMLNEFILEKLKQIPEEYLQEVSDFIDFILWRNEQKRKASNSKKCNTEEIIDSLTGAVHDTGETLDEYQAKRLEEYCDKK